MPHHEVLLRLDAMDLAGNLLAYPEWFPGAEFQSSKAAVMQKHAAIICNTTFAATEELMCDSSFGFLLDDTYMYTFPGQR